MAAASAKELTDEQLQQMIAEAARRELAERQSK
jgi:cell division protein FtsB